MLFWSSFLFDYAFNFGFKFFGDSSDRSELLELCISLVGLTTPFELLISLTMKPETFFLGTRLESGSSDSLSETLWETTLQETMLTEGCLCGTIKSYSTGKHCSRYNFTLVAILLRFNHCSYRSLSLKARAPAFLNVAYYVVFCRYSKADRCETKLLCIDWLSTFYL